MKFVTIKFSAVIIIFLSIISCGGLSKNTKLTDESKTGLVIASVTQRNATQNMFAWIQRVGDHDFVPSIPGNYTSDAPNVSVFELPAGEYEFHRVSIVGGNASGNVKFEKPYQFTVKRGVATYVGNIDITLLPEQKIKWKLTDTSEHDIKEFKQRFPLIGDDKIKIDIADFGK